MEGETTNQQTQSQQPQQPPQQAPAVSVSEKSRLAAFLLAFFLGGFGIHRFYTGHIKSGVLMLILTISIIGIPVSGIWATIDWIIIVVGEFKDKDGKYLKNW